MSEMAKTMLLLAVAVAVVLLAFLFHVSHMLDVSLGTAYKIIGYSILGIVVAGCIQFFFSEFAIVVAVMTLFLWLDIWFVLHDWVYENSNSFLTTPPNGPPPHVYPWIGSDLTLIGVSLVIIIASIFLRSRD